jgi:hypothetical protein
MRSGPSQPYPQLVPVMTTAYAHISRGVAPSKTTEHVNASQSLQGVMVLQPRVSPCVGRRRSCRRSMELQEWVQDA